MVKERLRQLAKIVVMLIVCSLFLGPIVWCLSTSLKSPQRILDYPPRLIPDEPTLVHYRQLFDTGIQGYIFNSTVVSLFSVVLCLALGALMGYALARFQFRGKTFIMFSIVALMSIPLVSLLVPTYSLLAMFGMLNSRFSLILLYTAYQLPITAWLLKGFFHTIPSELEHAAMIDGYSRMQAMVKILLPLSKTGLVAAGLFVLVFAWNDFVVALVMTSSENVRTLPVGIYNYLGFFGREWGPLTAAAMVAIVPVVAIFLIFQRYFLSGVMTGGMKG